MYYSSKILIFSHAGYSTNVFGKMSFLKSVSVTWSRHCTGPI